jgi:hypothetical protein
MTVLLSYEYTEPRCPGIGGKRTEMTGHLGEGQFPEGGWCQLLHQERGAGESLASAENTLNSCIDGRDARQQKNRIEISETSALEV